METIFCLFFIFYRIEHLFPPTEINLPFNVFSYIQPKIAIFTTPNVDYNILFGKMELENGFRHDDHKFEWTRKQFSDWYTKKITISISKL